MSADLSKKKKGGGFLTRKAQSVKNVEFTEKDLMKKLRDEERIAPDDVLKLTAPTKCNQA